MQHDIAVIHIRGNGRLEPAQPLADPANPARTIQPDLFADNRATEWKSPRPARRKKRHNS
jgi:hypothetical protein